MPTAHIKQWQHNRSFLALIDTEYPDWAVTVAFYSALQAIDALLKHDNVTGITCHNSRNQTLMGTNRYSQIWKYYHPLYELSRTVRYLARPEKWVKWQEIQQNVINKYLKPIEDSVKKLAGLTEELPPITMKTVAVHQ